MSFLSTKLEDIKRLSVDECLILFVCASLFLPMEIASLCMAAVLIFAFVKRRLYVELNHLPGTKFLYAFCILEIGVSLFYSNQVGVVNAIGMLMIGLYIVFYRKVINPKLFEHILDLMIFLSIIVAILGLFEFNELSNLGGYSFFEFHVQNKPSRRIHVFFMNANLYAMMIEFFIVSCLYRWVKVNSLALKSYYVAVGLINIGMLYLTGCRTAFLPLAVVVPLFFVLYGEKKWIYLSLGLIGIAIVATIMIPDLIPRLSDISTLKSRFKIWNGAVEGIQMYPLFGNGPQTYGRLYPIYGWHKAPHAHNIYIDAISSYGLVGTFLLCGYYLALFKDIWKIRKERALYALMISFIVVYLLHGIFDCTLNFVATGTMFFMVLNTGAMVLKEKIETIK